MISLIISMSLSDTTHLNNLDSLRLPPDHKIEIVAAADNVRQLALAKDGTLFAGSRNAGNVYGFKDTNGDGIYDQRWSVATDLNMPSGIAVRGKDLYVAEVHRILRFPNATTSQSTTEKEVYFAGLPDKRHHGWKYLKFGPDGSLYFNIGAPCNVCLSPLPFATLVRLTGNKELEIMAEGVRNSVGFTWHPESGNMWFTDNGRDHMGDDLPPDELNRLDYPGQHFGYPYRHGSDIKDPKYGKMGNSEYTQTTFNLGAHVAPLGLTFYTGSHLPRANINTLFITEHGSWNRSSKVGYRVMKAQVDQGQVVSYQPFIEGWLQGEKFWGRPNDILVAKDGSLLISDDYAGLIYRVSKR